ncbi:MAG: hypothetical protein DME00_19210 [Candidatus Rokuibacteriota bacterium]|nr:MAG: hypothetical protein DME00_19210 [Candidatus Rokubacteria bacterium]
MAGDLVDAEGDDRAAGRRLAQYLELARLRVDRERGRMIAVTVSLRPSPRSSRSRLEWDPT